MSTPVFDVEKYTKSRWLKGLDLPKGRAVVVTIAKVYEHHFETTDETKPIADFEEVDQSLPLNKTQITVLIDMFGKDVRLWVGQRISLQAIPSSYGPSKPTILIAEAPAEAPGKVPGYSREDAQRDVARRAQQQPPDWATEPPPDNPFRDSGSVRG